MKNYILSIVLVLSINVFSQTKPTTTTTTTTTTQTTKTESKPITTETKPVTKTTTTTTQTTKSTKPASTQTKSTTSKSTSTKPKSTKSKSSKSKSKTPTKPGDKVVKKALYTPKEKEKTRQNFIKEVDKIGMTPEVRAEYTTIVKKHWARIEAANNERKLTKDQATDYVNRVISEQNSEIQRILTVEEYNKHELIMNRYHNSVLYRIEQQ